MDQMLLDIFAEESQEQLDGLEHGLLELESSEDPETINTLFRAAHTMKGNAGIVGFEDVVELTHRMESLFARMRDGGLAPDPELVGLLLGAVDALKMLVAGNLSGDKPSRPGEMLNALDARLHQKEQPAFRTDTPPEPAGNTGAQLYHIDLRLDPKIFLLGHDPLQIFGELKSLGRIQRIICHSEELPAFPLMDPELLYLWWEIWISTSQPLSALQNLFIFVWDHSDIEIQAVESLPQETPQPGPGAKPAPPAQDPAAPPPRPAPVSAASIRVGTGKLDNLVNLSGELSIRVARMKLIASDIDSEDIRAAMDELDLVSRDLQEQVMRARMIPMGDVFGRFQRLVHDLALEQGKKLRLELGGLETEIDKNISEKIVDPIKHLIRNSADHGVEPPAERLAAGKAETGVISLKAYQQEGMIIIELGDDGRGLDREKILAQARDRNLLPPESSPTGNEINSFIFKPGFSTAPRVTELSGRGVGLDVVSKNIEELRGSVEVDSAPGRGATFRIKLPLTLAIIDCMKVRLGTEILSLPLLAILESVKATPQSIKTVEGRGEVLELRGEYLPLIRLGGTLELPAEFHDPSQGLVVILESVGRSFGVLVDDILGEHQAVIKNLEQNYHRIPGVAGATILGDGTVSLIVDIHGLEKLAFA